MATKQKELENATEMIRVYPSDHAFILSKAQEKRTSAAQIVHELLQVSQ